MYAEVTSLEDFSAIVDGALDEYNNTHKNRMNLVIFRSAHPYIKTMSYCNVVETGVDVATVFCICTAGTHTLLALLLSMCSSPVLSTSTSPITCATLHHH